MFRTILVAISLVLCCSAATAQTDRFSKEQFNNGKGDTLQYRLLFPDYDTSYRYPLVIFLHGAGERGNDNEAQLKWGVQQFATDDHMSRFPAFVIAPQCPTNSFWSNTKFNANPVSAQTLPTPSKPMELLFGLIQQFCKNFKVDTNRIYITGLSMGGFGTFDAISRQPNLFAAAVPVCGVGDVSKVPVFKHIPIWILHGAEDPTVNVQFSIDMLNALTKAGAHPGYTQYPSTGHFSWIAAYNDELVLEWLFRQHK